MAVSMRDLDPAFQGAGQKAYPLSNEYSPPLQSLSIINLGCALG
jgi:hypothetical protein